MRDEQQARNRLGQTLRDLRLNVALTGKDMAARLGCHPSKVSRVELGRQTPTQEDVAKWVAVVAASPETAAALLDQLRALDTFYTEWRRQLRGGIHLRQQSILDEESAVLTLRSFESNLVHGLLQSAEYAQHMLTEAAHLADAPPDVEDAVAVRMQRQELLYRARSKAHFLISEAVLRYLYIPAEIMLRQLERLSVATTMGSLRVGIIPFGVRLPVAPEHGFDIHDGRLVLVETVTAELRVTQPEEVRVYERVFDLLASAAVYGADARELIEAAIIALEGAC